MIQGIGLFIFALLALYLLWNFIQVMVGIYRQRMKANRKEKAVLAVEEQNIPLR